MTDILAWYVALGLVYGVFSHEELLDGVNARLVDQAIRRGEDSPVPVRVLILPLAAALTARVVLWPLFVILSVLSVLRGWRRQD